MKRKLFVLAGCVGLMLMSVQLLSGAEIGQKLTSKEVKTLLSHKTFAIQQFLEDGDLKNFYAYFAGDGSLQIHYDENFTKSAQWKVGSGGEVCLQVPLRRRGTTLLVDDRCGALVKKSPYSFDRINDKGERTATITLIANGNKFPKK